jgi:hypothetical protein
MGKTSIIYYGEKVSKEKRNSIEDKFLEKGRLVIFLPMSALAAKNNKSC